MTSLPLPTEQPRKILLVEDQALERLLVRDRLRREPLELIEAPNALIGLQLVRERSPDLILLDLGLPDLPGLEFIRRIKQDPVMRSIPIVVLSGATDTEDKVRALDLGAVDFISKPFDPIELRARIRTALRTKYLTDFLEQQANLDALTGLANRHALFDRFEAECAASVRRNSPLSVLIADLDYFKQINDRYGHHAGDLVLQSAARVLRELARRNDLVARYGGEEFVILAPDCDITGGLALADRVKESIAALQISHGQHTLTITVSLGAVTINDPAFPLTEPQNASKVLQKADQALYSAKAAGRNVVHVWSELHAGPVGVDPFRVLG